MSVCSVRFRQWDGGIENDKGREYLPYQSTFLLYPGPLLGLFDKECPPSEWRAFRLSVQYTFISL